MNLFANLYGGSRGDDELKVFVASPILAYVEENALCIEFLELLA
jgi:hypothetical protein